MRNFLMAVVMCGGVTQGAMAADMPDLPILRGSIRDGYGPARPNWDGFYIGGQAAYGTSNETFTGSNSNMTAALLANTLIESSMQVSQWPLGFTKQSQHGNGYGGFLGYNSQWDDVVIGVEMSYLHGKFGGADSGSMARLSPTLSDGLQHSVTSSATSSIAINDIGTFRARAGYAVGNFLPYLFGGLALGQADVVRTVTVKDDLYTGASPGAYVGSVTPLTATQGQYSHLIYGYTAGLGFDVAIAGGLFLRGEWEYIRFTSAVDTSINTVRAGVGYKF
jgi:opacity protein-like surface antigen